MVLQLVPGNPYRIAESKEVDRYVVNVYNADCCFYDEQVDDLLSTCKIVLFKLGTTYDTLQNYSDFDTTSVKSMSEMKKAYKYHVDQVFGKDKYNVYYIKVYNHGIQSFSLTDRVKCGWDTYCIGIIAIRKDVDINKFGERLTNLWNGWYSEVIVNDEYEDEPIEDFYIHDDDRDKTVEELKNVYHTSRVNFHD